MKYNITERLNQTTADACMDFCVAMLQKLYMAQVKNGYSDEWLRWGPDEMRKALREHVEKGDPRDVANIAMFLWARGEKTV